MRKENLFVLIFSVLFLNAYSQQKLLNIRTEINKFDNSISFTAENNSFNTFTVVFNFHGLEGYTGSLITNNVVSVYPGIASIGKLERIPKNSVYNYRYNYSYFIGKYLRKIPDTNFTYLLPTTTGKMLHGSNRVISLEERLGQKDVSNFHDYIFKFELGDTICAARGGIVYSLADEMKEGEKKNETYTASRDKIHIEQKDGTLAQYIFTAPVNILVSVGDKVTAGQPIAVFNTPSDKMHLLFSVYYLDDKKLTDFLFYNNDAEKRKQIYQHLPVKFYLDAEYSNFITEAGKFKVLHPVNIITQEMTKKEFKKFSQ